MRAIFQPGLMVENLRFDDVIIGVRSIQADGFRNGLLRSRESPLGDVDFSESLKCQTVDRIESKSRSHRAASGIKFSKSIFERALK